MTDEEKKEKLKEYSERHSFWANQVLNQFGFSINLFLTIGIGFIAYLIPQRETYPKIYFDFHAEVAWDIIAYFITIVFLFSSIVLGSTSVTSRLYDLRLTRHIIWVRKRSVKKIGKLLPDGFIDLTSDSTLKNFLNTLRKKVAFIKEEDFKDYEQLKQKFENLRKQSKLLGELSWKAHKFQIMLIVLSTIAYGWTMIK